MDLTKTIILPETFLNENDKVYDPRKIIKSGENAMKEMIKEKVILFGSNSKA